MKKQQVDNRFKELFFDEIYRIKVRLDFRQNGKNVHWKKYFNKNNNYLGTYNQKSGNFWLSNKRIWSKLESEFTLNYLDISELTKSILEEHYKLKNITTGLTNWYVK